MSEQNKPAEQQQHTPGEWQTNYNSGLDPEWGINDEIRRELFSVYDADGCGAANARLAAAAPELLAACLATLTDLDVCMSNYPAWDKNRRALRAAITKATGEQ